MWKNPFRISTLVNSIGATSVILLWRSVVPQRVSPRAKRHSNDPDVLPSYSSPPTSFICCNSFSSSCLLRSSSLYQQNKNLSLSRSKPTDRQTDRQSLAGGQLSWALTNLQKSIPKLDTWSNSLVQWNWEGIAVIKINSFIILAVLRRRM